MKITANKKAEIKKFEVLMDYGEFEKKRWVVAFLKLAQEKGELKSETIEKSFGIPATLAGNITKRLIEAGFIANDVLTPLGHNSLATEQVPLFKHGPVIMEYCDDPLLRDRNPYLGIEETEIKKDAVGIHQLDDSSTEKVPDVLLNGTYWNKKNTIYMKRIEKEKKNAKNRDVVEPVEELVDLVIKKIYPRGRPLDFKGNLVFTVILSSDRVFTLGATGDRTIEDIPCPMHADAFTQEIQLALKNKGEIQGWMKDINKDEMDSTALVKFSERLTITELVGFKKDFFLDTLAVKDLDNLVNVKIENVPIFPASSDDAALWARKILISKIEKHIAKADFENLATQVYTPFISRFPKLQIPDRGELLAEIFKKEGYCNKYWFLQATIDLIEGSA